MYYRFLLTLSLLFVYAGLAAQGWTVKGVVLDKKSGKPIEYATVVLSSTEQWAVADAQGKFVIKNVPSGKNTISVSCLGYVTDTKEVLISKDIDMYKVSLYEDNLTLESVVVTARENDNSAATSRTIDRTALDHVQVMNVADISSLLPGGTTISGGLTNQQIFNIRSGSNETGNASFGTAVEVDGVRISNNSAFSTAGTSSTFTLKGATTNNIASSNVESVEVITGVPSVEYGDMTSGVVKINTRKGVTPYTITMSSNPGTKQVSASKGFGLGTGSRGRSNGVLNASVEYTKSISDQMSPYTSYRRNSLSLTYTNLYNSGILADTPLRLTAGVTGNIGGMNTKADPDTFRDTFSKARDNALRGNISLSWLLSKKWITNLELNTSVSYSDKLSKVRSNYSSAAGTVALHAREEGYYIAGDYTSNPEAGAVLIPRGYWYNTMVDDNKPLNYKVALKANWARQFGEKITNKVKLGGDWTGDGNFGVGEYSEDPATAPSYWEYRYCDVPFMNNLAVYLEDNFSLALGQGRLNLIAGIRGENTFIKGSDYGNTSSWSPRFNAKYTVLSPKGRTGKLIRELSFRGGWGVSVKLPSFSILYPVPTYFSTTTFNPVSSSDGSAYYAYYILPKTLDYNPSLTWQRNKQSEIGMEINIGGYNISVAGYYNRTLDAYRFSYSYSPFTYNYTSIEALESNCSIPADNRIYSMDGATGQITVSDKTGASATATIPYTERTMLISSPKPDNSVAPSTRYGVEWIVDFKKINPINTTIRVDGSFYGYKYYDRNVEAYSPVLTMGTDGQHYKYIGYYYGGDGISNGKETKQVKTNVTVTTNIPKVRMVLSLKVETCLMKYSRALASKPSGSRTYLLSDKNDLLSIMDGVSVYEQEGYPVTFPDYYTVAGDPTPRDFLADFRDARENDPKKYTDLARLAITNSYVYTFKKDYISPYFSANISVTKEIGDIASISFYANNFFYNIGKVYSTKTGNYSSSESYIPKFYYGLTLRFKF
ncbi:MAG: TonB-dependent receptor domain-containing protein [Candidatus Cryptobacteroides sp.]